MVTDDDPEIRYRHRNKKNVVTLYEITVENPANVQRGIVRMELDGSVVTDCAKDSAPIALTEDGRTHLVRIVLG